MNRESLFYAYRCEILARNADNDAHFTTIAVCLHTMNRQCYSLSKNCMFLDFSFNSNVRILITILLLNDNLPTLITFGIANRIGLSVFGFQYSAILAGFVLLL